MSTISKQEYMKPFQYDSVKRAWSNFYEKHYEFFLEYRNREFGYTCTQSSVPKVKLKTINPL